jgi:hypothetical protein
LPEDLSPTTYPDGNFFPASFDEVGFVDLAGGDYELSPTSPHVAVGTDGKDPGVDWKQLQAAQSFRSPSDP